MSFHLLFLKIKKNDDFFQSYETLKLIIGTASKYVGIKNQHFLILKKANESSFCLVFLSIF